ncbi:MAG: nuclear transport factor 2 family protein [Bacteroidota bacterium]
MNTSTSNTITQTYLAGLAEASLEEILDLFAENGQVISPLYGKMDARSFYTALFQDTKRSKVELIEAFPHPDKEQLALYFNYRWTMEHGTEVEFDVVDIIECNTHQKIERLTIIYDTQHTRNAFGQLNQE